MSSLPSSSVSKGAQHLLLYAQRSSTPEINGLDLACLSPYFLMVGNVQKVLPVDSGGFALFSRSDPQGLAGTFVPKLACRWERTVILRGEKSVWQYWASQGEPRKRAARLLTNMGGEN